MPKYQIIRFLFFTLSIGLLSSYASSGQISGVKIIEENKEKKYTLIKTDVFTDDAVILKDTTNEFNRFDTKDAVGQYIPSLTDVQEYESILKSTFISNNEIAGNSDVNSETLLKHFKNFKRQYSGYINSSGDTLIVVCFINFTNRKKARKYFYNWKYQQIYLGSALYYLDKSPPSMYCYLFNKHTKHLSRYKI